MNEPIHIISLGAGVQSSTMALMAAHGEITPMPKCAIFADTGDEPKAIYTWLEKLTKLLPFPVYVVSKGPKLSEVLLHNISLGKGRGRFIAIPTFGDRGGMSRRQCTREFKVDCINRKLRELREGRKVELWIGISLDEVGRMKPNRLKYITNIWPLIDKRMTRWDCLRWLKAKVYDEPPKSACVFCPYHSNSVWREIKKSSEDWKHAVEVDRQLNKRGEYVHRSLKPLDQVDFSTDEDHGQQVMFGNECEGMCGV